MTTMTPPLGESDSVALQELVDVLKGVQPRVSALGLAPSPVSSQSLNLCVQVGGLLTAQDRDQVEDSVYAAVSRETLEKLGAVYVVGTGDLLPRLVAEDAWRWALAA